MKNTIPNYLKTVAGLVTLIPSVTLANPADTKPNVLLIVMDDMCDWHHYLGGHSQVITPNLDRLSKRGVFFSNAYCGAPLSNPSRASMLTNLPPYVTGIYNNENNWQDSPQASSALAMPDQFKQNGYTTYVAGKLYHTKPTNAKLNQVWDDWTNLDGGYGPWPTTNTYPGRTGKWENIQEWTGPDSDHPDIRNSQKILDFVKKPYSKPFFCAMGFYRPHTPYNAPKRYYDLYDADTIKVPETIPDDLDDIPKYGYDKFIKANVSFQQLLGSGDQHLWRERVKAYMACVSFADDRIGMILDALDNSPNADNTIIVVVGDNGFHHGEKQRWGKSALWREASHVPMMVVGPKNGSFLQGGRCDAIVSLLDVYPTLNDLCGLSEVTTQKMYGKSVRSLLEDPQQPWDKPVVVSYLPGNFAVHSNDWSYIQYADGSEELYATSDENEYYNLAGNLQYASVKANMKSYLPENKQRIIYVKPNGTSNGDSWNDAANLTDGISIANQSENMTNHQLWLAKGTYAVNATIDFDNLQIYGGFAGTEIKQEERNWYINSTILDGGGAISLIRTKGAGNALADGIVIQNGSSAENGGAAAISKNSTLKNCIIRNNKTTGSAHGGGISVGNGTNIIENCLIINNTSAGNGGGVQLGGGSTAVIINSTIAQNVANNTHKGAGIGIASPVSFGNTTTLSLYNSIIHNNKTVGGDFIGIARNQGDVNLINLEDPANPGSFKTIDADCSNSAVETTTNKFTFDHFTGNIQLNQSTETPMFTSPSTVFGQVLATNATAYNDMLNASYALRSNSPCIDKGNNEYSSEIYDLACTPRINGTIDMGAYEYSDGSGFTPAKRNGELTAFRRGDRLMVIGTKPGETIRVYTASGIMLKEVPAEAGATSAVVPQMGILLIETPSGQVKVK